MFCNKPTPLYTTQYPDICIKYKEVFNMHAVKRNPLQLHEVNNMIDSPQLVSGKLIHTQNKHLFAALKSSKMFATIDYEALINTKINDYINHVSKTMLVAELEINTLHSHCEIDRTQL